MGAFAGLLTYLVAVAALLGGAVIGIAAFLHDPTGGDPVAKQPPQQLVRAADRKKPFQPDEKKAAPVTSKTATPQAAPAAAAPNASVAELAKKQAKLAKPKKPKLKSRPLPEIDDTTALGFAAPPRSFNSPFFR